MTSDATPPVDPALLDRYLDEIKRDAPALGEVVEAFRPLKLGQAQVRAGLPELTADLPSPDPARLAQGVPLASPAELLNGVDLPAYLHHAAQVLRPRLAQGFPALAPDLQTLDAALAARKLDLAAGLKSLLAGQRAELEAGATAAGLPVASLEFILLALAKPLLEKRAQALGGLLTDKTWDQGSCPVCGSLPEMSYLIGEGGQRWLRCSLCAHHWRFSRTTCPVCGCQEQNQMEFLFAEGREHQRVDLCKQCGKYVVCLDVRGLDRLPAWEVAALGLVHLDLLAQQRGLVPAAPCAWNQLG